MSELSDYFFKQARPVLMDVTYYMPDHAMLLQTFTWQMLDVAPDLPRVQKFLDYWHHNIEAVIKSVEVSAMTTGGRPTVLMPSFVTTIN